MSYLHVVLTDLSPHVSNLGCTRPWEEAGGFFLGVALGISAWDLMGQTFGGMGAGLPWHRHLHEGESAFWSPSSLCLTATGSQGLGQRWAQAGQSFLQPHTAQGNKGP